VASTPTSNGGAAGPSSAAVAVGRDPGSSSHVTDVAQVRLNADKALMSCVREDGGHHTYFSRPPLRTLTLSFEEDAVEKDYRHRAWRNSRFGRGAALPVAGGQRQQTLASNAFNAYSDMLVSALIFCVTSAACFLHYSSSSVGSVPWFAFFALAAAYHAFLAAICFKELAAGGNPRKRRTASSRLYCWGRRWLPSHLFGLGLLSLPFLGVMTNFSCTTLENEGERVLYLQLCFFGIVHFCNLTALANWVKSLVVTLLVALLALFMSSVVCPCRDPSSVTAISNDTAENITTMAPMEKGLEVSRSAWKRVSRVHVSQDSLFVDCDYHHVLYMESLLCLFLLTSLVWLLNREFETSYRYQSLYALCDRFL